MSNHGVAWFLTVAGSVEDLVPETIEQAAVPAVVALVVVDHPAVAVVEAAEDLEVSPLSRRR